MPAKLAKIFGHSPFPHASQHVLALLPHPGVSYLFQNQTSAADKALGASRLARPRSLGSSVLNSPSSSWSPALCELVLEVDSKFKVCQRKKKTELFLSPLAFLYFTFFSPFLVCESLHER
jgi:hypothetical protein